ncbi:hypothetical protein [Nocardia terpenica]|uniref:hypothetical protein n=1 Tax=Nocardia terpenica TaxID=455432 RepID=UPI000B2FDF9B|nr:hypothetical protein [Nocardia terpenica]NQE88476.1 hypothetical protein [Nocardia terpenica]
MTGHSRTFFFPGGMLQVAAYDDDSDDDPGVYLELYNYPGAESTERPDSFGVETG